MKDCEHLIPIDGGVVVTSVPEKDCPHCLKHEIARLQAIEMRVVQALVHVLDDADDLGAAELAEMAAEEINRLWNS